MASLVRDYEARLRSKRRGLGSNPRNWLRLALYAPGIGLLSLARLPGLQVALYPDHFGHQAIDVEHHLRRLGARRWKAVYLVGSMQPNSFLFEKHAAMLRIIRLPPWAMRYVRNSEKSMIRLAGRSLLYSVGFEAKLADWPIWKDVPYEVADALTANRSALLEQDPHE